MADKKVDVVVIGTGTAATTVALECGAAGRRVAVVDSKPFGGTCALRGCDPKKVLVGVADVAEWSRRMLGKGIREQARIEWGDLMRFKRTFTGPAPKYREESFAKAGIAAFHGRARFVGPSAVEVGKDVLEAKNVVVAAGAKAADLQMPGAEHVIDNERFLELDELPRRIVFLGGGYISFEFAHVAARAGAQATILHRGPRPLVRFDPDLVDQLVAKTRSIGVEVVLNAEAKGVSGAAGRWKVRAAVDGRDREFEAELVVHGAGRAPDIDDLDLAKAGVTRDRSGVKVNEYLQSVSNAAVYAAGDAAASGGPQLTPVAGYEGAIVADNLLEGNHRQPDYQGVASVVYTLPPLATVGLGEQEARERGLRFRVNHADTSGWYSSRRVGEDCSGYKVLVEEGTAHILGAHLLGPQAEEVINLFALAVRKGLTAEDLKGTLFAYPTHGSDVQYMVQV
ncbi:MAG TPA: NAD(P)/FAD-dependent oxidoreductase [Bryobacterales bacterium]|nr:NAD(P)/FAD-dependent oxidoreductase [Bryobacterales bacterium]